MPKNQKGPSRRAAALTGEDLLAVTAAARERSTMVEFAGFLVREDADSIYVADPQGTWVIGREDAKYLGEWEPPDCGVPPRLKETGRPVRVSIRDGATIHEIRPWQINVAGPSGGQERAFRAAAERIFSLGGEATPPTSRALVGEDHLRVLERTFSRRLGWNPSPLCNGATPRDPRDPGPISAGSKTYDCPNDGNGPGGKGCTPDTDAGF